MGESHNTEGEHTLPEPDPPSERETHGERDQPSDDQLTGAGDHSASESDDASSIREQLEEALREKDQFRTIAQRAQADLVNFKRRAAEEQREVVRHATTQLILKVLPFVDDLDRALEMVPDDAVASGWLEGLRLVTRKIESFLGPEGVTKIDALGKPFEPLDHEAVLYEQSSDGVEEGIVVRVFREGYKRNGLTIRAAQVVVSRAAHEEQESETTDEEA